MAALTARSRSPSAERTGRWTRTSRYPRGTRQPARPERHHGENHWTRRPTPGVREESVRVRIDRAMSATTRTRGIPVTTPRRTIADLRRVLKSYEIDAVVRRAEVLRLDIGRQPGYEPDRARSDLERRVLRICRRHGLPEPEVNVTVGPYEVDFFWRELGLVIETDGFEHHGTRSAFEADRERDVELRLMGLMCLRFTHRQVADEARFTATLSALLTTE
jgi:very-short-patch-repair endonuclease